MSARILKKLPIIVCDIDGVLLCDKKALPKVNMTMTQVRKPLGLINPTEYSEDGHNRLPFVLLTNNQYGYQLEADIIKSLNEQFCLSKYNSLQ